MAAVGDNPITDLTDLDDIRRELAILGERLEQLPDDAFGERLTIRTRQRDLRVAVQSIALAGDLMSADQLERRIDFIRSRIKAHYGNRLTTSSGPQTGMGGGLDPKYLHQMNRAMDKANNIDALKKELRKLDDRLAAMRRSG